MLFRTSALVLALAVSSTGAFSTAPAFARTSALSMAEEKASMSDSVEDMVTAYDKKLDAGIRGQMEYVPGGADTEFARRFGHLVGAKVRTVGEAFAEFSKDLGYTVNALYKNMITDIVGTTHLITVNARFSRDPVWSYGILTTLELLLKNYPEKDTAGEIKAALFKCVGMDLAEVEAEAATMKAWAVGKSRTDIEAALNGEGDSALAGIATTIKGDEFWMYSRYFGIGLLKMMEDVGIEMDKDEVYPIMENWMTEKLGRSHLTACADSDLYFKIRDKLEMMETMMKEIEIREKKRMAARLEDKAEAALRAADRETKFSEEIDAEAKANRDRVESP